MTPLQILYAYINSYLSTSISKCTYTGVFLCQMSIKGGRGWTYDETREECFFHQLEDDKPDLNLWNSDVQKELEVCFCYFVSSWLDVNFPVCASKQAVKISISFRVYSH